MNEVDFNLGMFAGMLLMLLAVIFAWHMSESECQTKHNVSDCVLSDDAFVPAQVEPL